MKVLLLCHGWAHIRAGKLPLSPFIQHALDGAEPGKGGSIVTVDISPNSDPDLVHDWTLPLPAGFLEAHGGTFDVVFPMHCPCWPVRPSPLCDGGGFNPVGIQNIKDCLADRGQVALLAMGFTMILNHQVCEGSPEQINDIGLKLQAAFGEGYEFVGRDMSRELVGVVQNKSSHYVVVMKSRHVGGRTAVRGCDGRVTAESRRTDVTSQASLPELDHRITSTQPSDPATLR